MEETRELVVTRQELTPTVLNMFMELDQAAYKSRRFGVTEGETAIKMLFCYENGLPLSAANTGLYVVNGRMEVMGNIVASQLRQHPEYDYQVARLDDKGCTIRIVRHGDPIGEATFDESHAARAGLLGKDNWKAYPEDMYFNRAMSKAYKRFAPDIFSGPVYVRGEISGDVVDATWTVQEPVAEVKAVTLDELVEQHGADAVLAANGGKVPASVEEVQATAEKLKGEGDD